MLNCPLCRSSDKGKLGEIAAVDIATFYHKALAIDVSSLLADANPKIELFGCNACDLKWYSPARSGNAEFYANLQRNSWYYQDAKPEYEFASKWINPSTRLLEVGCGKGAFSQFISPSVAYYGLEFNEEAVKAGRETGLDISIDTIEAHAAVHPEAYDVVCTFQTLEHVSDPRQFLESCARATKRGGLLIVAVPSEDSFLSIAEDVFLNMPPHHMTRWTDKALANAFERVAVSPLDAWHEPVAEFHKDWYCAVMASHAIRRILRRATRLHSDSLFGRVVQRIGTIRRIRDWLVSAGERSFPFRGRGHTICMVGRKPPVETMTAHPGGGDELSCGGR